MGKGRDKKKKKKQQQGNVEDNRKQRKLSQGDELKNSKKSKYIESSDDEDIDAILESFKAKVGETLKKVFCLNFVASR